MVKINKRNKKINYSGNTAEFEDLPTFEQYLKDEREDNEIGNAHAHIQYIPPFVLQESHNDPDRVKDSQNRKNKKFVRHLHQHVEKHLLEDIKDCSGMDVRFGKPEKIEDFDTITWRYEGMTTGSYKVQVIVKCDSNGAAIDVRYDTVPVEMEVNETDTLL